ALFMANDYDSDTPDYGELSEENIDDIGREIKSIFDLVKVPGDYCADGKIDNVCLPGLFIHNIGHILLPLSEIQAKLIIEISSQVPFGINDQTIYEKTKFLLETAALQNVTELQSDNF
ncbi:unnamed protein product, partial [Didymodactylos carnosus]